MLTAFLTRSDVSRHAQALTLLRRLREALSSGAGSGSTQPLRFEVPDAPGSTLVRHATLPGLPAWAVTVRVEATPARPAGRTLLHLHDAKTGGLLALMDAGHLQTLRASLVSALATDTLARERAANVAVLGSGLAASGALKALRLVRSIERVWMYEPDLVANTELTIRMQKSLSTAVHGVDSAREAVEQADVVVLSGGVPLPVDALKPGAHVTVLAAEHFASAPLPEAVWARARRFCDATEPALPWGGPFHAELGQVLAGQAPGRTDDDELTVFASQGPAFLDLVAAWHVYSSAREDENLTRVDLES